MFPLQLSVHGMQPIPSGDSSTVFVRLGGVKEDHINLAIFFFFLYFTAFCNRILSGDVTRNIFLEGWPRRAVCPKDFWMCQKWTPLKSGFSSQFSHGTEAVWLTISKCFLIHHLEIIFVWHLLMNLCPHSSFPAAWLKNIHHLSCERHLVSLQEAVKRYIKFKIKINIILEFLCIKCNNLIYATFRYNPQQNL